MKNLGIFFILINLSASIAQINVSNIINNSNKINNNATNIRKSNIFSVLVVDTNYLNQASSFKTYYDTLGFVTSIVYYNFGNIDDSTVYFYNDQQLITQEIIYFLTEGETDSLTIHRYMYNRKNQLIKETWVSNSKHSEKFYKYDRQKYIKKTVFKTNQKRISQSKHINSYCKRTNTLLQTKSFANNKLYEIITYTSNGAIKESYTSYDVKPICYQIFIWIYNLNNQLVLLTTIFPEDMYYSPPIMYLNEYSNNSNKLEKKLVFSNSSKMSYQINTFYKYDDLGNVSLIYNLSEDSDTINSIKYIYEYYY